MVLRALRDLPHSESCNPALAALEASQQAQPNHSLQENFQRLSPEYQNALGTAFHGNLAPLLSLSAERDSELFNEGLLSLGRSSMASEPNFAAIFFGLVGNSDVPASAGLRGRAEVELSALRGEGNFGTRFEVSARSFARQATDPGMLVAMTAGGLLFSTGRAFTLSRLLSVGQGC